MTYADVTLAELARRLDRMAEEQRSALAEMRTEMRSQAAQYVTAAQYRAERQAMLDDIAEMHAGMKADRERVDRWRLAIVTGLVLPVLSTLILGILVAQGVSP